MIFATMKKSRRERKKESGEAKRVYSPFKKRKEKEKERCGNEYKGRGDDGDEVPVHSKGRAEGMGGKDG